ncbi:MAG: 1-deoxy-D-xylulose-5-phosphate reductoisomerase [Nitrospirae bacterium RIFCSPHIGHO2_02_FULL_42_12]|nr:MAG: 1-deoxy-D-xylulose-5-phosphate reductoisomerase [Nitrospirae bacterium RIFCSPHIGHO2_02_FULL_42_12]
MKNISILGSTGSIGCSTLDVISRFPERFKVVGLSACENIDRLEQQIRRYKPSVVSLTNEKHASVLKEKCKTLDVDILSGVEGLIRVSTHPEAGIVVSAIAGSAGLIPTLAAVKAGKTIALANKETMVMAGEIVVREANEKKAKILPVDSEHSAIFQVMEKGRWEEVHKIILTASGGPFLRTPSEERKKATIKDALRHPNWNMGAKVTIDSATLMNKGLEVIEAKWLFDVSVNQIKVLIHPQSIVHSMVEFRDGSVIAQMGMPDMKVPIAYALSYPERLDLVMPRLDLAKTGNLTFEEPEKRRFPCLYYAYDAINEGGSMPAVLNSANEIAVQAFLHGRIGFLDIERITGETMGKHKAFRIETIEDVLHADNWARQEAEMIIGRLAGKG